MTTQEDFYIWMFNTLSETHEDLGYVLRYINSNKLDDAKDMTQDIMKTIDRLKRNLKGVMNGNKNV